MSTKFYAVKAGRTTGIFTDWDSCKQSINGFSGAVFKSFTTIESANEYLTPTTRLAKNNICIYTDGSSMNKKGGYAFIIVKDNQSSEFYGKVPLSPCTNNQAELYAVYMALNEYQENVDIYTDSKYVIDCVTQYINNWHTNGRRSRVQMLLIES